MKKILLVAALVLGFAVAASAQPRAIGIRGGWGVELSYQHSLGNEFVQADLGLVGKGLNLAASYNFSLAQFGGGFNVYGGPSAAVGLEFGNPGWLGVGVGGNIGIEYIFSIPLQLSLELRPQVGLQFHKGLNLAYWGYPTLGIRYAF